MQFEIGFRFSSRTLAVEIDAKFANEPRSIQLGAAIKAALATGANLTGANLAGANLTGANLAGANLTGANLAGAKWRDGITITKRPLQLYGLTWAVTILDAHMQIGCELHAHDEWAAFDDARIAKMGAAEALRFWHTHKDTLLALCRSHAPEKAKEAA